MSAITHEELAHRIEQSRKESDQFAMAFLVSYGGGMCAIMAMILYMTISGPPCERYEEIVSIGSRNGSVTEYVLTSGKTGQSKRNIREGDQMCASTS